MSQDTPADTSNPQPPTGGVPLRISQVKGKDLIQIEYGDNSPIIITADAAFELGKALIDGAFSIHRNKFVKLIPNKDRKN